MTQDFEIGDLVQLKSGGPAMVVKEFIAMAPGRGDYLCEWLAGSTLREESFPARLLRRFKAPTEDSAQG